MAMKTLTLTLCLFSSPAFGALQYYPVTTNVPALGAVSGPYLTTNGSGGISYTKNAGALTNINGSQVVGPVAAAANISAGAVLNPANGNALTNLNATNIVGNVASALSLLGVATNQFIPPFKAPFSTNYTVSAADSVMPLTGTNQVITLENGTNGVTAGRWVTFLISSTTGAGTAVITNANGVQTVLTATALSQTITNGQSLTLVWDGSNWR